MRARVELLSVSKNGIFSQVCHPVYGKQDVGVSPGGAMDRFSHETGNIILGNKSFAPALEIIMAPDIRFNEDCFFILTGAKYNDVLLTRSESENIQHGRVYKAMAGSILTFGEKEYGFRTYLCYTPARVCASEKPHGRIRGDFSKIATWHDPDGGIRVIEGPEFKYLKEPHSFLENSWKVTSNLDSMGMRIENSMVEASISLEKSMVSEAVSDGTVQLTPDGPIILLKHRQTIGGYPRIFNVISADVDMLGQYFPGQLIHFKKVAMKDALDAINRKNLDIKRIIDRYNDGSNK